MVLLTPALHLSQLLQVHPMATLMLQFHYQLVAEAFQNREDILVAVQLLQCLPDYLVMLRVVARDLNPSISMQQVLTVLHLNLKYLTSKL